MTEPGDEAVLAALAEALPGSGEAIDETVFSGPAALLPSVYAVSAFAAASVALATNAVAAFQSLRSGHVRPRVFVERAHAAAAFRSERYLEAIGWTVPPAWDPIAGDYETADGHVRLHTNYSHHRDAALRVLGTEGTRGAVERAVATWNAKELENAIIGEGGCAAKMRTAEEFAAHPAGLAVKDSPLFSVARSAALPAVFVPAGPAPLASIRVLDLTRVIAGPVCTRFLAAYGATVLRVDPPAFDEVPALLGDTTGGKRRAALDLRVLADRIVFERLVSEAHVLVSGYRSDALDRLGFDAAWRRSVNPSLVTVELDAYGWSGPWASRRGFDSLVQMSVGIASRGRDAMRSKRPFPLPAQALDHGTGYLAAAAVCRGLSLRVSDGAASLTRLSLARTATFLMGLGDDGDPRAPDFTLADAAPYRERIETPWGSVQQVRCPGSLEDFSPHQTLPPGPLGSDPPRF